MSGISSRFKELREEKNLTQTKMAAEIAVKRHHIVDIESDKQRPPYETIRKYAEYFNVSTDWLITGEGDMYAKADNSNEVREADVGYVILPADDLKKLLSKMDLIESELREIKKAVITT